jgi:hypothetical protein
MVADVESSGHCARFFALLARQSLDASKMKQQQPWLVAVQ